MKRHCDGFTLVEVIASLLIVGILGAIAGMGIVTGLRGYMQAKENGHLAQKAQIALTRINRELMELTDVISRDDGADPWVVFDNRLLGRQAIAKVGSTIRFYSLAAGATNLSGVTGDTLIDQVDSFTIQYFKGPDPDWVIADGINLMSAVKMDFALRRKEGREGEAGTVPFSTTINPRNTENYGGAPATTEPATASQYQCFVSAAASSSRLSYCVLQKWPVTIMILVVIGTILAAGGISHRSDAKMSSSSGKAFRNERGNVLVGLVVILLLFAALGTGMVSLIGTSSTSQVTGNTAVRAYYIAESGFRYAASRYLNTNDTNNRYKSQDEKNQVLEDLHDDLFTLGGGDDGQFRLKVFPYFLSANGNSSVGSSGVSTQFSGGKPEGFTLPSSGANARVKIGDVVYPYNSYNDSTGQLNLSSPLEETVYDNAVVKLLGLPAGSATVARNGDLTLAEGGFFPKVQGRININGVSYGYVKRNGNVLQNVTMAQDRDESFSISVDTSTEVVLEPFVRVHSIGMVGQGELAAAREVVYNVPLLGSTEKVPFIDDFSDLSNWNSPTFGSFAIEDRGGENVLAVTAVDPGFGVLKAGLIAFNWTTNKVVNFAYSHRLAGYYLSYDNQVKIGFDATPFPETGYGPEGSPIPKHYAAGLAFRLDENENFYGLSFMRGCAFCDPADRIPDEIVPENDVNLVVLWQQTGNGTNRKWLAYSELGLLFSDGAELEPPPGKWISENDHLADPLWTRADNFARSPSTFSWTTSPSGSGSYSDPPVGEIWNDYLISEPIDLSQATAVQLTFWTRYRLTSCEDWGFVEVSGDSGSNWDLLNDRLPADCIGGIEPNDSSLASYTGNSDALPDEDDGWVKKTLDISTYAGNSNVRIRFRFERNCCTTSNGWWVDDIRVIRDFPVDKSTLLVRINEGALVTFDSGGTTPIEKDDFVTQSNGAEGRVIAPPILASGSWAGGNAAGRLLLNNTSPTAFTSGLPLNNRTKGVTAVAGVTAFSSRENLIQAYYGAETGVSPPPTSPAPDGLFPYDQERLRNLFGTANWPPDAGEPTDGFDDYFTLVQWNDVVDSTVTRAQDFDGRYSIIITDTLTSPTTYFPFTRPEIGLQVAGHGAANVYFKDYGVQLGFAAQRATIPIQQ
ncbi:MAG: immune inhibitor A [Desulfobacterales bacterium]|jgi:prepilin-type N-terminal cleavage/methylation domain-containing protein